MIQLLLNLKIAIKMMKESLKRQVVHGGEELRKNMEEEKLKSHFKSVELLTTHKNINSKQKTINQQKL